MSYCRFGEDSDLYIIGLGEGKYNCCGCYLMNIQIEKHKDDIMTKKEILNHIALHEEWGDKIPDYAKKRIEGEEE